MLCQIRNGYIGPPPDKTWIQNVEESLLDSKLRGKLNTEQEQEQQRQINTKQFNTICSCM